MTSFFGFFREGLSASPSVMFESTLSPVTGLLAMTLLVPLNRRSPYPFSRRAESGGVGSPESRSEECPESCRRSLLAPAVVEDDLGRLGEVGINFEAGP